MIKWMDNLCNLSSIKKKQTLLNPPTSCITDHHISRCQLPSSITPFFCFLQQPPQSLPPLFLAKIFYPSVDMCSTRLWILFRNRNIYILFRNQIMCSRMLLFVVEFLLFFTMYYVGSVFRKVRVAFE